MKQGGDREREREKTGDPTFDREPLQIIWSLSLHHQMNHCEQHLTLDDGLVTL